MVILYIKDSIACLSHKTFQIFMDETLRLNMSRHLYTAHNANKKQDFDRSCYGFEIATSRIKRCRQERTPAFSLSLSDCYIFGCYAFDITKGQSKYYSNIIGFESFFFQWKFFLSLIISYI